MFRTINYFSRHKYLNLIANRALRHWLKYFFKRNREGAAGRSSNKGGRIQNKGKIFYRSISTPLDFSF